MYDVASKRWDDEYKKGRYDREPPISFVKQIIQTLKDPNKSKMTGLYAGCGNGRNYLPLIESGLDITGLDISRIAINKLIKKQSDCTLHCMDFLDFECKTQFDYIILIQMFQHGTAKKVIPYFDKVHQMLKPGGLLFLRVNSSSTTPYYRFETLEKNTLGGFTVKYPKGPKKDMAIHFYSKKEIMKLCPDYVFMNMHESVQKRTLPKHGSWYQWECVIRKK